MPNDALPELPQGGAPGQGFSPIIEVGAIEFERALKKAECACRDRQVEIHVDDVELRLICGDSTLFCEASVKLKEAQPHLATSPCAWSMDIDLFTEALFKQDHKVADMPLRFVLPAIEDAEADIARLEEEAKPTILQLHLGALTADWPALPVGYKPRTEVEAGEQTLSASALDQATQLVRRFAAKPNEAPKLAQVSVQDGVAYAEDKFAMRAVSSLHLESYTLTVPQEVASGFARLMRNIGGSVTLTHLDDSHVIHDDHTTCIVASRSMTDNMEAFAQLDAPGTIVLNVSAAELLLAIRRIQAQTSRDARVTITLDPADPHTLWLSVAVPGGLGSRARTSCGIVSYGAGLTPGSAAIEAELPGSPLGMAVASSEGLCAILLTTAVVAFIAPPVEEIEIEVRTYIRRYRPN